MTRLLAALATLMTVMARLATGRPLLDRQLPEILSLPHHDKLNSIRNGIETLAGKAAVVVRIVGGDSNVHGQETMADAKGLTGGFAPGWTMVFGLIGLVAIVTAFWKMIEKIISCVRGEKQQDQQPTAIPDQAEGIIAAANVVEVAPGHGEQVPVDNRAGLRDVAVPVDNQAGPRDVAVPVDNRAVANVVDHQGAVPGSVAGSVAGSTLVPPSDVEGQGPAGPAEQPKSEAGSTLQSDEHQEHQQIQHQPCLSDHSALLPGDGEDRVTAEKRNLAATTTHQDDEVTVDFAKHTRVQTPVQTHGEPTSADFELNETADNRAPKTAHSG